MFIAFMISGQYHFLPRITGLRSDKARSTRSTPPIPQLYVAITAGWVMFSLSYPLIHLLAFSTGSTSYALLPMVTTDLSFQQTIFRLLVRLKSYSPLSLWTVFYPIVPLGTSDSEFFSIQVNEQLKT